MVTDILQHADHSIPKKQLRVPSATRPGSAPRPWHARPTHQSSVSPAKDLPPMPDPATGGRGEAPSWGQIAPSPGRGQIRANDRVHIIFGGHSHPGSPLYTHFKTPFPHKIQYTMSTKNQDKYPHTNFNIYFPHINQVLFSKSRKKWISKTSVRIQQYLSLIHI